MARRTKPAVRKNVPVSKGRLPSAGTRPQGKVAYGDAAPFPISMAVRAGDFVFTSALGDHGFNPDDVVYDENGLVLSDGSNLPPRSVEEETRDVLRNIESALGLAGCTLADVVDSSVWLRDPRDFKAMNSAYREFFRKDCPTRSIFRIDFMFDCRVEIKVIAYKPLAAARGSGVQRRAGSRTSKASMTARGGRKR